jgi:hypothetical protein
LNSNYRIEIIILSSLFNFLQFSEVYTKFEFEMNKCKWKLRDGTVHSGCFYNGSAHPDWRGPRPSRPFSPRQKQGRSSPRSAPVASRKNLADRRPVVGSGVVGEQARSTVNQIWGEGWRCSHLSSLVMSRNSTAEDTSVAMVRCPFHRP